jgi:hypothetical protein
MRKFGTIWMFVLLALAGCSGNVSIVYDTIAPATTQLLDAGQSVTLTATVYNDSSNSGVTWALVGGGTLSNQTATTVTYTAPATVSAAASATVTATPVKNSLFEAATQINYSGGLAITTTTLPTATIGAAYSTQLANSGGSAPILWTLASGSLPAGLTLSSSGLISGTPTTVSSSTFVVRATDSANTPMTATASLTLNVTATPLVIGSATVPNGVVGKAYSDTLTASGGVAPYTWSVASGTLPPGLTLSAGGVLSGSPTTAGLYTFTAQVTDTEPSPQKTTKSFTFTIYSALAITTASLPNGSVKDAYTATLQATGGSGTLTWTLASGTLPAGLTLSSTGVISGTPTTAQQSTFTVQVSDTGNPQQTATATYTLTVVLSTLVITTTSLPNGTQNAPYSATLQSSGGNPPVTWSIVSGTLPPSLTLNSATGVISGTPSTVTTANFTVQATDTTPASVTQALTLTIVGLAPLTITTATLPNGNIGTAYSSTLMATGGATPYTWSVASGTLPVGLMLSSSGVLSGTPLVAGAYTFSIQVKDSEATPVTVSRSYTVTIGTTLATGTLNGEVTGSYAFLVNGFQVGSTAGKVYGFAEIGSLTSTGAGTVTGIEDSNNATGVQQSVAVTGTYSVGSDGRGLMVLTAGAATTVYSIAVSNVVSGVAQTIALSEFDNTGTGANGSGYAKRQTTTAFTAAGFKGNYAFGLAGESPCSTCATGVKFGPVDAVGVFTADGVGTLSAGQEDAAAYSTNYTGVTLAGTFTTPSATTGRGTLKLTPTGTIFAGAPADFTYVIVSASEVLAMSNDSHATNALLYGDVELQQQATYSATSFTGRSIGYESQASGGDGVSTYPAALNAILTELTNSGSGTATYLQDANRAGTFTAGTASSITYTVATSGRAVLTTGGASNQVIYLYNTGAGFALDQAATSAYPALAQYELQIAVAPFPTLLSGSYGVDTVFTPAPATTVSGVDTFTRAAGGVDGAAVTGMLATMFDSNSPGGTLALGQTGSYLFSEDTTGLLTVTLSGSATTQSIVDAITSTRAVSIPASGTTPVITVLQQ